MISVSVSNNLSKFNAQLADLSKSRVPAITAKALTATVAAIRTAEIEEVKRCFDRPNPFTQRAFLYVPARPDNLVAKIFIRESFDVGNGNAPADYLRPQIEGGKRKRKRFEQALMYAGFLPPDMYAVPGERAQLDQYGNVRQSQIIQILSALRAFPEVGYLANRTARSKVRKPRAQYFVGHPGNGKGPLGVWQRVGTGARPVLIFVKTPTYKPRFDFYGVAQRIGRGFEDYFDSELKREMALRHN